MRERYLSIIASIVISVVLTTLLQPLSLLQSLAQGTVKCQTFRETGKTVCNDFLLYWQQHGGLPVFGYPISQPFQERSQLNGKLYTVQYFERTIFEMHPENKPPYNVLLSQLGTYRLHSLYPNEDPGEPYVDNLPVIPDAQDIQITHGNGSTEFDTTISYISKADPNEVLTFYKDVLIKDGWSFAQPEPNYLSFGYQTGRLETGVPRIDVRAESEGLHRTKVTVKFLKNG